MARKGLPSGYLKAAWKTKGANKSNALKRAWAAYNKSKKKKTKKTTKSSKTSKTSGANKMARRRQTTIPLALVAPIAGTALWAYKHHQKWSGRANLFIGAMTGFDPGYGNFNAQRMKRGLVPLIIGAIVHKFVGGAPLNVNRALGAARVPFIRI